MAEANFCKLRIHLKLCMGRSLCWNRRREFSLQILNHPPVLCFSNAPNSLSPALQDTTVGHGLIGKTMTLCQFLEEIQCCSIVSTFGKHGFWGLAFVIHSLPNIIPLAIHLDDKLVQVPLPLRRCTQLLDTLPPYLSSKYRAKPVLPIPDSYVTHVDAWLVQQIFDIPKARAGTVCTASPQGG